MKYALLNSFGGYSGAFNSVTRDDENAMFIADGVHYPDAATGGASIVEVADDWVVPKPLALEEAVIQFETGIQAHLDAAAQAKGYDNITAACSYAGAPNPFEAEAKAFITWRGNVWAYCYQELAKVQDGTRPMPTFAEIISELPAAPI